MKNLNFIKRFDAQAHTKRGKKSKAEASRKRIREMTDALRGTVSFPEKVARAKEFCRRAALKDKRFTTVSAWLPKPQTLNL